MHLQIHIDYSQKLWKLQPIKSNKNNECNWKTAEINAILVWQKVILILMYCSTKTK